MLADLRRKTDYAREVEYKKKVKAGLRLIKGGKKR